ncbi:MAG: hypothetical protein JWM10_2854 [Myxococcaceae bacterium]|nr:hypothetical protein [Myxococcaceae bacterium]
MKTIKPQKLGLLCRTIENDRAHHFVVTLMVFAPLDGAAPLSEVDLWKLLPQELGEGVAFDAGMPKSRAEWLVNGKVYAPGGEARQCSAKVRVGASEKSVFVFGDRQWSYGAPTQPAPFREMPLAWSRAFGGEGYAPNPAGRGFAPVELPTGPVHALPNFERPEALIETPGDRPRPAGFGPIDFANPQRIAKAGTHDARWLEQRYPGFAEDMDWTIFNAAPEDQWVAGFFRGDEAVQLVNLHPTKPVLDGRLPGLVARAFVTQRTPAGDVFREVSTRIDTVHLLPNAERVVVIYRGSIPVAEDDAADVVHLLAALEDPSHPKGVAHYEEVLAGRLDKQRGAALALRDRDLLPAPRPGARPPPGSEDEFIGAIALKGYAQQNGRRLREIENEKARAHCVAKGLDPDQYGPPPLAPDGPLPEPEELATRVEQGNAQVDGAMAAAATHKEEALAQARAQCTANGLDFDAMAGEGGGPPGFSAQAEIDRAEATVATARAQGAEVPELEALLADRGWRERLFESERRLKTAYQQFAQLFPAANLRERTESARLRQWVVAQAAAKASMANADLTGVDLSGLDLRDCDLRGAFLERANLMGANLRGADLTGAVLARANLTNADLSEVAGRGANLGKAKLHRTRVAGADLAGAILHGATLHEVDGSRCVLTGVQFHETALVLVDLHDAALDGAMFFKASLTHVRLTGASLRKAMFVELSVAGADFDGAVMDGAVFVTVDGAGASFRDAQLRRLVLVKDCSFEGAVFTGAMMDGANLRDTALARADFSRCRLRGADFSGCDLREASFHQAYARDARFVKADLRKAGMLGVDLMDAILQKANLRGTNLQSSSLFRADLFRVDGDRGTNLAEANLTKARIDRRPRGQG